MSRLTDETMAGTSPAHVSGPRAAQAGDLGVATVRQHTTRLSQFVTLAAVVVPPAGSCRLWAARGVRLPTPAQRPRVVRV